MNRAIFILIGCIISGCAVAGDCYRIASYNVENFFDSTHDTLKNDSAFLPDGPYRWHASRFYHKAQQIARVVSLMGEWDKAAVIGLCEVENAHCLAVLCRELRNYGYRFLHFEGPDRRGVDVALLYDLQRFRLIDSAALRVDLGEATTRDILYAAGVLPCGDTLHLYECHLPSMSGGQQASEWKRQAAKAVIRRHVDSLLQVRPKALVAVMGDMNCRPTDDITGLTNRMIPLEKKGCGSHRYHGIWSCLDQIYLSPALDTISDVQIFTHPVLLEEDRQYLDSKPRRTFQRFRYDKNGFSDHLPVYFDFCLP